jgi:2-polyprenyl-3-methyl-5-hydroxy-6-metoxy-1,4-benzoquinol methylase
MTELREHNARSCFATLAKTMSLAGKTLLDVGCAAGWFLNEGKRHGLRTYGVELDQEMATCAQASGHAVEISDFPHGQLSITSTDLIAFNDVFEHLPQPTTALRKAHSLLNEGGVMLLAVPSSGGTFYRTAKLAARLGFEYPLERLWQKGFESPHLYYYHDSNLRQLAEQHGFTLLFRRRLKTLSLSGLWDRINEGGTISTLAGACIYTGIVLAYPLIAYCLPADSILHAYVKRD